MYHKQNVAYDGAADYEIYDTGQFEFTKAKTHFSGHIRVWIL